MQLMEQGVAGKIRHKIVLDFAYVDVNKCATFASRGEARPFKAAMLSLFSKPNHRSITSNHTP